ncbi:predicted protein [Sclerotinia sclerotiorum 1980 UF-70]|uniref:Uncharacterized protein n=1 Tax=Sclerotinia sclerotiorum (strain ATCC 18683 / 1980 / Ss-1) TaxID=665079 RepID=A7EY12_SCLS1|nr:predicted protein [Sclerotinia sclerotiorum 1980 UF-70]EDN94354.1 predicted protein [Sclerotinia sclerotiorum 1980 UF-70]
MLNEVHWNEVVNRSFCVTGIKLNLCQDLRSRISEPNASFTMQDEDYLHFMRPRDIIDTMWS